MNLSFYIYNTGIIVVPNLRGGKKISGRRWNNTGKRDNTSKLFKQGLTPSNINNWKLTLISAFKLKVN